MFVSRLGLDYLIRESMQASSPAALGQILQAFCGPRVGAIDSDFVQSCQAGALLMDASHDNPSLLEKRTIQDALSTAALGMYDLDPRHVDGAHLIVLIF